MEAQIGIVSKKEEPCIKRPNSGSLTKRRGSRTARSLRSTHLALLSSSFANSKSALPDTSNISRASTPTPPPLGNISRIISPHIILINITLITLNIYVFD